MRKLIFLLITIFLLTGCSSDDKSPSEQEQDPNAEIADNVVVILEENSELISTEADLLSGIYKIQFNQSVPEIEAGDVIVGDQDLGFLRRVSTVSISDNLATLQTTQGNMEDVFGNTSFSFSSDLSQNRNGNQSVNRTTNYERFAEGVSRRDFTLNLSNTNLFSSSGASLDITEGSINFNPTFNFDFDFSFFSLDRLEINTQNTTLNANARFTLSASDAVPILQQELILYESIVTDVVPVSGIPVVITRFLKVKAKSNLTIGGTVALSKRFESLNTFDFGATYENDTWNTSSNMVFNFISHPVELDTYVTISENVILVPEVIIAFYGINGPIIEPQLSGDFDLNIATSSDNWDAVFKSKAELKFGASVGIFGESLETLPFASFELFELPVWNAPGTIEIVSGNNQSGNQGEQLAEPLKVKVLDNSGLFYLKEVPVYFSVTSGDGTIDNQTVMTDPNGFAEVNWSLGTSSESQQLTAKVKKANGSFIESIATFNADSEESQNNIEEIIVGVGTWIMDVGGSPCPAPNANDMPGGYYWDDLEIVFQAGGTLTCTGDICIGNGTYQISGNQLTYEITCGNYSVTLFTCNGEPDNNVQTTVTLVDSFVGTFDSVLYKFVGERTRTINLLETCPPEWVVGTVTCTRTSRLSVQ